PSQSAPPEAKPTDWWKAAAGEPAVAASPPPPPPVQPPPPLAKPPAIQPASPVIRESTLALNEPTGSPVTWMALGLVALGLACVAFVYGSRLLEDRGSAPTPVAENKLKPSLGPVDPPDDEPDPPPPPPPIKPKPKPVPPEPVKVDPKPPEPDPKPPSVTFTEAMAFRGHNGGVYGIAVSRTGRTILSVSDDRAVLVYAPGEKENGGVLHKLMSPGMAVALCNQDRDAVFCDGGDVVVLPLAGGKPAVSFENPRGGIRCLSAAADGSYVLTGTTDGCVRWWDVKTKALAHTLDVDAKATVTAVSIAPDQQTAAVGLSSGQVSLWTLKHRRQIKQWKGHAGAVTAVAVAPTGKIVSAGDDGLAIIWEPDGRLVKTLVGHDGAVTGVAWCADAARVVTAGIDRTVRRWDGGKVEWTAKVPDKVYCLALDARDRFVVVGQADGTVRLLPLPPGP
ncbi:MAG TPA: hypothetical protein VM597_06750, partial [Gemmataceae bacterium]|nr:hypothetical protein [Gemmataceae bacterium]